MPNVDPVLRSEVAAYVREDQKTEKVRAWERWLPTARQYIRAPENRQKILAETRHILAQAIRSERCPFDSDELELMYARDRELRAYVQTPQTRDIGPAAVHVDSLMTQMSVRFANGDYIGELLAPPDSVDKESNIFAFYSERDNLGFPTNVVGPRGEVPEVNQAINKSDHTYKCLPFGLKEFVTPREMANADVPLDPMVDALLLVMEGNAWNREVTSATFYQNSANYAAANITNVAAGEEYDSAGGGNPNKQIQDAVIRVFKTRGAVRRVGAMSINTYTALSRHPAIRDLFKYSKDGFAGREQLARYYNLDDLYVSEAWKDTANKGVAASYTRIWTDDIIIVCQNPGGGVRSYSHSKRFRKGALKNETIFVPVDGMEGVYHIRETYLEDLVSVAPLAGSLITNTLSPV
jgi:hypothetical protein